MSSRNGSRREGAAVVGVGVAACAVCCAAPIGGFLAAIGLGTAVGIAVFGTIALVLGLLAVLVLLVRRRRASTCLPADQSVLLTTGRPHAPAEPSSSSSDL